MSCFYNNSQLYDIFLDQCPYLFAEVYSQGLPELAVCSHARVKVPFLSAIGNNSTGFSSIAHVALTVLFHHGTTRAQHYVILYNLIQLIAI